MSISPFREPWLARFFPDGLDVRVSDALALILLALFALVWVVRAFRGRPYALRLPGAGFFALVLLAGLLSVFSADDTLLAIKYVLYPIGFSFAAYVFLPLQVIRTRRALSGMLAAAYAIGLVAAFMGALSLLITPASGLFKRATPLALAGLFPFGANHNLLAETLIAAFPFGFVLAARMRGQPAAFWIRFGSWGMALVALLTFARTAWIVLALQLAIFLAVGYRRRFHSLVRPALVTMLLASPLLVYMALFSQTYEVAGSLSARIELTRFAQFMFREHPWIGSGAGTFVERLGEAKEFTASFGDPLDAHGFIQKIGAEQGMIGLVAFGYLLAWILVTLYRSWRALPSSEIGERRLLFMLLLSSAGSITYQLFNTSYYNAKLWLPVGLALTAATIIKKRA